MILAFGLIVLACGVCASVWILGDTRSALKIVAKETGCPLEELHLVEHSSAFFDDVYIVTGCGETFDLRCSAQDPQCYVGARAKRE